MGTAQKRTVSSTPISTILTQLDAQGLVTMSKCRLRSLQLCLATVVLVVPTVTLAQDPPSAQRPKVTVEDSGTVEVPAQNVPLSVFLSPEAKAYVAQHLKDMQNPEVLRQDAGVPRFLKGYLARDYELFAVEKKTRKLVGYMSTTTHRNRESRRRTRIGS